MGIAGNARRGHLREHGARALLVLTVGAVVAIVGAGLVVAGVDRVEVVATLLFVPVFAAGLVVGRSAGLVTGGVATVVYLALRAGDVDDAGMASVGLLALTRAAAYAVAAEVGVRAQPLVDRLSQGNEWDDSPPFSSTLAVLETQGHRVEVDEWFSWPEVSTCMVHSRLGRRPGQEG